MRIVVGQWKLEAKVPAQIYLTIIQIGNVLITNQSDIDYIMAILNNLL